MYQLKKRMLQLIIDNAAVNNSPCSNKSWTIQQLAIILKNAAINKKVNRNKP